MSENKTKEQQEKPKWYQAEKVLVKNVVLVKNPKQEEELKAIKFYTENDKEIMYYAKKEETVKTSLSTFDTELDRTKPFGLTEFIELNPMLLELNKNCKKEPQEIVITYQGKIFREKLYFQIFKNQFESIYYEKYHKDDKTNLETQLTAKKKHELDLEMPLKK